MMNSKLLKGWLKELVGDLPVPAYSEGTGYDGH